jgi:SMC interacting uncharacterized protein involved in chromosome segregation
VKLKEELARELEEQLAVNAHLRATVDSFEATIQALDTTVIDLTRQMVGLRANLIQAQRNGGSNVNTGEAQGAEGAGETEAQ